MTNATLTGTMIAVLSLLPGAAFAEESAATPEIYVSTGAHGEVLFSDVAGPGAERVNVAAPRPPDGAEDELERRIEQTLAVANDLEASRLAREKARAEARADAAAARAQPAPQVVYQDRYVSDAYLWPGSFDRRADGHRHDRDGDKRGHGRRDNGRGSSPRTISTPFIYDPD